MKRRDLVGLALWIGVCSTAGCQIKDHPWSGEPYREPTGYTNPAPSIYAPMPSILPSVEGADLGGAEIQAVQPGDGNDPILELNSAG